MKIDAMSSVRYCTDCDKCAYVDAEGVECRGRYKTYDRFAARRAVVRAFGLPWSDSNSIVRSHPEVVAFLESLGDFPMQLFPFPCCPDCEVCAEVVQRFVVAAGTRINSAFIRLVRGCGFDAALLTLTAPAVACRPEHYDVFLDPEVRGDFRDEWLHERAHRRVLSLLRAYCNYIRPSGYRPGFDVPSREEIASLLDACEVLAGSDVPKGLLSEEEELDALLSDADLFSDEEPVNAELRARVVRFSSYKVLFERSLKEVTDRVSVYRLVDDLESPIAGAFQVKAWQEGWIQSVYGPGRHSPPGTPTFYIPRRGTKRFTYVGSEDGLPRVDSKWHRKFGEHVPDGIEPFRMSAALFSHNFRGFKKRVQNWHPDMVPGLPYSKTFQLGPDGATNRREFRKTLDSDKELGFGFFYTGVSERGFVDVRNPESCEEHRHLHLLINIPKGSSEKSHHRSVLKELWHQQTGNVYWGLPKKVKRSRRASGIAPKGRDPFCSPLTDDAKSARYVGKYQAKEGGRRSSSHGLNLRGFVSEQAAIGLNEELSAVVDARGSAFKLVDGKPSCQNRLEEHELEAAFSSEWVGLSTEERPIGSKVHVSAAAVTPPSGSIHRAGGVKVLFGKTDDSVVPFCYWVPKSVWVSALSNPRSEVSERLNEQLNSWAESAGDVLFPP